jgi:hypothetical protein
MSATIQAIHDSAYARVRAAAVATIEDHRFWNPDGIPLEACNDFLRRLSTRTDDIASFVAEALVEKLSDIDLACIAAAVRSGDDADIGRAARRAVLQHADSVLCLYAREAQR